MSKKQIRNFISCLIYVFCSWFIFAENPTSETTQYTKSSDFLHSYQLENGFEIHVLEDSENPLVQISFVSKAGYSVQNKENAGYPELAYRLFLKNKNIQTGLQKKHLVNIQSEFKSDSVIFQGTTSETNLENSLALFANAVQNPTFSEADILAEYNSLKATAQENQKNELIYINSNIDSAIFTSPWKQDTVLYSGITKKTTNEEIRNRLYEIYNQFYTPEKSCIFVTGPVNPEKVLELSKKYFSTWQKSIFNVPTEPQNIKSTEKRKFLLVSDNFSTDYNQIIIQYPTNGSFSDIATCGKLQLASLSLENSMNFKTSVCNEITGLYDETYIYAGFAENGSTSRVIIQSLMANNKNSPVTQAENVISSIDSGKSILEGEFLYQKELLLSQEITSRLNTKTLYNALVSTWAYGGTDYFYNYLANVKNLTHADIQSVFQAEPFVFLLVNSKTYKTHKSSFSKGGYVLLDQKTTFSQTQQSTNSVDISKLPEISYYQENIKTFKTYKLSNGIQVVEKTSKKDEGFNLNIAIKGGELFHYETPGLETITIKYFANNIKQFLQMQNPVAAFSVTTETNVYNSNIHINCAKNDVEKLIKAIKQALYFTELTAAKADELIFTENYNYRLSSNSLSTQLFNSGMETIFSGTKIEKLFAESENLLSDITFTEIFKSYTELLDSSRFSIVAIGNVSNLQNLLNETFKDLKPVNLVKNQEKIEPIVSNATRFVQLKRTFTTDIKAEDAGPRPLKLIPTTVFSDPVDFYFETPEKSSEDYVLFLALLTKFEENLNAQWKNGVEITVHNFYSEKSVVRVQFKEVLTNDLKKISPIFNSELIKFVGEVKNLQESDLENIKNQFFIKFYNFDNVNIDTANLISDNMLIFNDYAKYLKDYDFVDKARVTDFAECGIYFDDLSILEVRAEK